MLFRLSHRNRPIGYLELFPHRFVLKKFLNAKHAQVLDNILSAYFTKGIKSGVDKNSLRRELLPSDDPRFILELGLRLHTLGYKLHGA